MPTPPLKLPRLISADHLVLLDQEDHLRAAVVVVEVVMEEEVVVQVVVEEEVVGRGWAEWTISEGRSARAVNESF